MKKIEIEDDLYKYILTKIEAFGETPSQILRRLLNLPALIDAKEAQSNENEKGAVGCGAKSEGDKENNLPEVTIYSSLPDYLANGVSTLLSHSAFRNEPVITNKFKMILTTLYHEKRAAFIAAANTTKGRTRDYFGQNLSALLASDDKGEVEQLKASKPHEIPYTPFWVITNANSGRKRIILTQMMTTMGYPAHLIERLQEEI